MTELEKVDQEIQELKTNLEELKEKQKKLKEQAGEEDQMKSGDPVSRRLEKNRKSQNP